MLTMLAKIILLMKLNTHGKTQTAVVNIIIPEESNRS
jgi:hypothetical protein